MNSGFTNKILRRAFQRDLRRSLSLNANKRSTIHLINYNYQKKDSSFSSSFSKDIHKNFLYLASPSANIVFQKRNISNDTNAINISEKLSQLSMQDVSPTNEAATIISQNLPKYLINCSDWKIVELAQKTLLQVHEFTGLPWWASIPLTAFAARTVITLPFSLIQVKNTAKLSMLKEEMSDIIKRLKQEANYACSYHGWPEALARKEYQKKVKRELNELVVRENCHPAKTYILVLIQLPLWFSFSVATRNLSYMLPKGDSIAQITHLEMSVGGFGWVTNLTAADPYMLLPILLTLINLAILEVHQLFRVQPLTKFDKWRYHFFRGISLILLPVAICMPAATNIYWLASSSFGLLQAFLLNSTRVRRIFKVPIVETELEHPYRHFFGNLKSRLRISAK